MEDAENADGLEPNAVGKSANRRERPMKEKEER